MLNLQLFFQTVSLAGGRNPVVSAFLVALALQLSIRPDYLAVPDYMTRPSPTYNPSPNNNPSVGSLGFVARALDCLLGTLQKVPDNACERSKQKSDLTFDFIVVGAGAAGSVIAAGLSKNPKWRVLLLEAGDEPVMESVPHMTFPYGVNNTKVWKYRTEVANTSSQAFANGRPIPCGKQVGGSTGNNAMVYVCGQRRDYDGWAALGNDGWSYDEILPFIMESENNMDKCKDSDYHGFEGRLGVSSYPRIDPFIDTMEAAANELGYKTLLDINSGEYNGFVELQCTAKNGERSSAYRAFLQPAKNRKNLFVAKNALVTKVLFDGNKAIGVNVKTSRYECPSINFFASKETILSAGTFGSPTILLRSGVGPQEELKALGIDVVKNLPGVGENLQDHTFMVNYVKIDSKMPVQTYLSIVPEAFKFFFKRTGAFTQLTTFHANLFINATDVNSTNSDIQLVYNHFSKNLIDFANNLANFGFKDEYISQIVEVNKKFELLEFFTTILNPTARGKVSLRKKDPESLPKIVSNFFTNDDDIHAIMQGFNRTRQLFATRAMENVFLEFVKLNIEECKDLDYPSEEYDKCYLKYFSGNMWNAVGTCKMGLQSDALAVVNPSLQVHDMVNLRIADSSIMPIISSGNVQCGVYAIGQKALKLIENFWEHK